MKKRSICFLQYKKRFSWSHDCENLEIYWSKQKLKNQADGTRSKMGLIKSGVVTKYKAENLKILPMHCIENPINLSGKDLVKCMQPLKIIWNNMQRKFPF